MPIDFLYFFQPLSFGITKSPTFTDYLQLLLPHVNQFILKEDYKPIVIRRVILIHCYSKAIQLMKTSMFIPH